MGYRLHGRQKTYSIGPYGNGRDGTFSFADARRERDKAKDLLKDGKDPSTEKQLDKHRQAAARPFAQWADEWLAKKQVEEAKRGRIVAVRDPKTIEVLELRVGYVKNHRMVDGDAAAAVLAVVSEAGAANFPDFGGFKILRLPLTGN